MRRPVAPVTIRYGQADRTRRLHERSGAGRVAKVGRVAARAAAARWGAAALVAVLAVLGSAAVARAQAAGRPMSIDVDARDAPRRVLHARLTIPAAPGPLTLLYPKWIPGEHGPTGPIVNVAGLEMSAGGRTVAWRRDGRDMYTFHLQVPAGAREVVVKLDFLVPTLRADFGQGASLTRDLAMLSWNDLLLYPKDARLDEQRIAATLELPPGWKAGTALPVKSQTGARIAFAPVSVTTLVDSPVLAGAHTRVVPLRDQPPERIFMAADDDASLAAPPALIAAWRKLSAEASALFAAEHFRSYTFLLTLSDQVASFGLEHHESSDNRVDERTLIDEDYRRREAGLLPHEFVHSWNGKYRRPAGLAPGRFDTPMDDELLWIYEGLTEYLGQVLAARSGLLDADEYRQALALTAADMEMSRGRRWRPLADTAIAAQILYDAPREGQAWRRGVDFYPEGELLWLDVDTIIRRTTGGKKSLDDFCRKFYGPPSGPPTVVPYELEDVEAALNAVAPYDWKRFFQERVYQPRPRPPLAGLEAGGWALAWTDKLPPMLDSLETAGDYVDERYAIGIRVNKDGIIPDVIPGSPAALAGVASGSKLIGVNGRRYTDDRLRDAVRESTKRKRIELITENADFITHHVLKYDGGPRYPKLERIASRPDLLSAIIAPLTGAKP